MLKNERNRALGSICSDRQGRFKLQTTVHERTGTGHSSKQQMDPGLTQQSRFITEPGSVLNHLRQ